MIRILELILDNNLSVATILQCEYIDIEISYRRFPFFQRNFDSDGLA